MSAGDAGLQTEIYQGMLPVIQEWTDKNPKQWLSVRTAVDMYIECYNREKIRAVRDLVLAPLGLDEKTFLSQQRTMADSFVERITSEMVNFSMPDVETIITGTDHTPFTKDEKGLPYTHGHIYMLRGNISTCCDSIGFAAIGSGARHAESQFMLAGHQNWAEIEPTILLVYSAKKKSEVAPGVGEETDIISIFHPGTLSYMSAPYGKIDTDKLDEILKRAEDGEKNGLSAAKEEISKYLETIRSQTPQQNSQVSAEGSANASGPTVSNNTGKAT